MLWLLWPVIDLRRVRTSTLPAINRVCTPAAPVAGCTRAWVGGGAGKLTGSESGCLFESRKRKHRNAPRVVCLLDETEINCPYKYKNVRACVFTC